RLGGLRGVAFAHPTACGGVSGWCRSVRPSGGAQTAVAVTSPARNVTTKMDLISLPSSTWLRTLRRCDEDYKVSVRLEQRRFVCRRADVLTAELRDDSAAGGSLQEAELEQVRLVDVLDRVRFLAEGDGQGREADRPAFELLDHGAQQSPVGPLEAALVDLHQLERLAGDLG